MISFMITKMTNEYLKQQSLGLLFKMHNHYIMGGE